MNRGMYKELSFQDERSSVFNSTFLSCLIIVSVGLPQLKVGNQKRNSSGRKSMDDQLFPLK
jgi:hypothetical protein